MPRKQDERQIPSSCTHTHSYRYIRDKQPSGLLGHPHAQGQADDQIQDQQQQIGQPSMRQDKLSAGIMVQIDHFRLQTAYLMHKYKPQEVLARHMFTTECVRSACSVYQHSCLPVRAHLFQVISSLLA